MQIFLKKSERWKFVLFTKRISFKFLREILVDFYEIDPQFFDRKSLLESIKIENVEKERLSKELKYHWLEMLGNSEDLKEFLNDYAQKFESWLELREKFLKIASDSEMKSFVKENFSVNTYLHYEDGDIGREYIERLISYRKPKIPKDFKGKSGKILSFKVFENEMLHICLHLKLDSDKIGIFRLLITFSLFFERPSDEFEMDLEFINQNYSNLMLIYNIMNKLKVLEYEKKDFFQLSNYDSRDYSNAPYLNHWVKREPYFFRSFFMELLNENPFQLFDDVISHLKEITEESKNSKTSPVITPENWFDNLSNEIKNFLKKGEELFLKTSELLKKPKRPLEREEVEISEDYSKEKVLLEEIAIYLKKILINDEKNDSIDDKDKGFRTLNKFHKKFKRELGISRQTLYNLFNKESNNLYLYFEIRDNKDKGGGSEYRFRRAPYMKKHITKEAIKVERAIDQRYLLEKMRIMEALIYYKDKRYKNAISIFKNIAQNPSDTLIMDKTNYFGCLYYLGNSYYHINNYHKVLENFEKINFDENPLFNVMFDMAETYRYLRKYDKSLMILTRIIEEVTEVLNRYNTFIDFDNFFRNDQCIKFTELEEKYPSLLMGNEVEKYLISFEEIDIRDRRVLRIEKDKQFEGKWHDYAEFEHDYANKYWHGRRNFDAIIKLYDLLKHSLFLKSELIRRMVLDAVLNKREELVREELEEFLAHISQKTICWLFNKTSFENLIKYFSNLLQTHLKSGTKYFKEKIKSYYPEYEKKPSRPFRYIPEKYRHFIYYYISINRYYEDFHQADYLKRFGYSIENFEAELKAEFYITKIYSSLKYSIAEAIKNEKGAMEDLKLTEHSDILNIYSNWEDYHQPWRIGLKTDFVVDCNKKIIGLCRENELLSLERWTKNLYKDFREKAAELIKLRSKGRKMALNRAFEILYDNYNPSEAEFEITYGSKPEDINYQWFIYDSIITKINNITKETNKKIKIRIKLFNQDLTMETAKQIAEYHFERHYKSLKTIRLKPIVDMDLSKNALQLTFEHILSQKISDKYTRSLNQLLDCIPLSIFDAILSNINEFFISYVFSIKNDLYAYFDSKFTEEFANEYFDFEIEKMPKQNQVRIQITKK